MKFLLQTQIGVEDITLVELERKFGGLYSLDYVGFVPHKNGIVQIDWRSQDKLDFYRHLGTVEDAFFVLDYVNDLNPDFDLKKIIKRIDTKNLRSRLDYFFDKLNEFDKSKDFRFVTRKKSPHRFRRVDLDEEIKNFFDRTVKRLKVSQEENKKEIWTTLIKNRLIIGVRLTDKSKRHSYYKTSGVPGSLRPTVAYALAYISEIKSKDTVWDPFCGAGTIACEICENFRFKKLMVGDISDVAIEAAKQNLVLTNSFTKLKGKISIKQEDFFGSKNYANLIITNLPFGKQYSLEDGFIDKFVEKINQIKDLRQITILFKDVIRIPNWQMTGKFRLQVLGQACYAMVFRKVKTEVA